MAGSAATSSLRKASVTDSLGVKEDCVLSHLGRSSAEVGGRREASGRTERGVVKLLPGTFLEDSEACPKYRKTRRPQELVPVMTLKAIGFQTLLSTRLSLHVPKGIMTDQTFTLVLKCVISFLAQGPCVCCTLQYTFVRPLALRIRINVTNQEQER